MNDKEKQIEARLDRKTALNVLQDLSKEMYPSLDLFGHPTLVIDRSNFEEIRKKYLDELPKDSVVLTIQEHEKDIYTAYNRGYKKGCKETAGMYHKAMRKVIHERDYIEGYAEIGLQEENDEIAKQFNVEIKE